MLTRKERCAAEHAARKADRKAGFPNTNPPAAAVPPNPEPESVKREPSEAQLAANRTNAQ